MAFIAEETVQKIKDSIDIVSLIGEYVELKRAGANYKGLCPFHSEKTPSFIVSEQRESFHCFGCHEGGDAIGFIMKLENLDYPDALRFLADKYNIPIQESHTDKKRNERYQKLYQINRDAMLFYYKNLLTNRVPQEYLVQRQLKADLINKFYLGYADSYGDSLYQHLKEKGHTVEDMIHLGLVSPSNRGTGYYDRFRNRLMFPIINTKNRIIGFGGRIIGTGEPKYLNSPESDIFHKGENIYGVQIIQKSNVREKILLVEGYMDVIGLHQQGIEYGVASLGTALTPDQAKLVSRYGKQVFICYDGDKAGINAARKAIQVFEEMQITPKLITLPDEMDPDDFAKLRGREAFEKEMQNAQEPLDFELSLLIERFDLKTLPGRKDFVLGVTEFLANIDRDLVRDLYVERVSKLADVDIDSLKNDVKRMRVDPQFLAQREKERRLQENLANRQQRSKRSGGEERGPRSDARGGSFSGNANASSSYTGGAPSYDSAPDAAYYEEYEDEGYTNAPDEYQSGMEGGAQGDMRASQSKKMGTNTSKAKREQEMLAFEVIRLSQQSKTAFVQLTEFADQALSSEPMKKIYERIQTLRNTDEIPTVRRLQETLVGDVFADVLERLYREERSEVTVDENTYGEMAQELGARVKRNQLNIRREDVMLLLQEPDDALESLGTNRTSLIQELQELDRSLKARGGTRR